MRPRRADQSMDMDGRGYPVALEDLHFGGRALGQLLPVLN